MCAGLPLHARGRSATAWSLSCAEQAGAAFRTAPGPKESVVVVGSAPEAEALVELLRPSVRALGAQPDAPRAAPSHGVDGQSQRLEPKSPTLMPRDDRDPVEV